MIKTRIITSSNFINSRYYLHFLSNKRVRFINKSFKSPIVLFDYAHLARYINAKETEVLNISQATHIVYNVIDRAKGRLIYRVLLEENVEIHLFDDNPNDFGYTLPK